MAEKIKHLVYIKLLELPFIIINNLQQSNLIKIRKYVKQLFVYFVIMVLFLKIGFCNAAMNNCSV